MDYAWVNIGELAGANYDANDRRQWLDVVDQRGRSVRLLLSVCELMEKEAGVLRAVRDRAVERRLEVDPGTRPALRRSSCAH